MDQVTQEIIKQLFVAQTKLPNEPMAARERAFGVNAEYRRSAEKSSYTTILQAEKVQVRESQVSVRMALE